MSSVISVTLDTSCIIDLGKDQPPQFRRAMEKLLELAREGRVDLGVTTRVESEAKYPSTIEAYRNLIRSGGISVIASPPSKAV